MLKKYNYLPACKYSASDESDIFYVYGLIHPITKDLRYVGQTYNLRERASQHCNDLHGISHKINWVKSLKEAGMVPELIILEAHTDIDSVLLAEMDLIEYYRFIGCSLTNQTIGGEGRTGDSQSFSTRRKISNTLKSQKNKNSSIVEKELANYIKERPTDHNKKVASQYVKDMASQTHKGKTMSVESKKKISDGLSGEKHQFFGKKFSNEHKLNIVKSRKLSTPSQYKLSFEQAEEIRELYSTGEYTLNKLGNLYGVAFTTISKIINNHRYKKEFYVKEIR